MYDVFPHIVCILYMENVYKQVFRKLKTNTENSQTSRHISGAVSEMTISPDKTRMRRKSLFKYGLFSVKAKKTVSGDERSS